MPMLSPVAVDEVNHITPEDFKRQYVDKHCPLIIRGGVKHWPAMHWTDKYLVDVAGHQLIKADSFALTAHGESNLDTAQRETMSLAAFAVKIAQTERYYYILDLNLPVALHQDLSEHCVSSVFPVERRRTFWWGRNGQKSHLHYDDNENLMCLFDGEKEFLLFDVTDFNYMYPKDATEFRSIADPDHYDPQNFPFLTDATPYIARIYAGDILYVPCYWWHRVKSFGRNIAVSYIINETLEQRVHVAGRLIAAGALQASNKVTNDLLNIIALDEKPARRTALLKQYHRDYYRQEGQSYYPHSIFNRLIEENLFDILRGHATY